MAIRTLKNRLIVGYLVGGVLVSLVAVLFMTVRIRHLLIDQLDHSLTDKMRFVRSACVQHDNSVEVELGEELFQRIHDPDDPEFIQLSLADSGEILLQSPSFEGEKRTLPKIAVDSEEPHMQNIQLADGRKVRVGGQSFYPVRFTGSGEPVKLHLIAAHDVGRIEEASKRILVLFAKACAVALVTLSVLIHWIVRRNLSFFQDLSSRISSVSMEESGASGIQLEGAPREVVPVLNRLNELMERMERALKNERRFTSDAAHELRTPLAGLRNRIELALSRPRSNEEYEEALVQVLEIEDWIERLVQSLLLLARLEAGTQRIDYEPLPVPDLIRRSWKLFFERAEEGDYEVDLVCDPVFEPPRPLPIELLEIVCRNLFDNALSYTEPGGEIRVMASETQFDLTIEISNSAITADSKMPIEEVFLPFTRGAQARTAGERHSGIGLALCRRVVRSLNGQIEAMRPDENSFLVRVKIPIAYLREIHEETETEQGSEPKEELLI
ncbi:MAG: GHKL domain-containing protein [Verrucomicrobiae bacterium]|nr:GHKL domain-containing protein [Verrucomicrobiae bacterium]